MSKMLEQYLSRYGEIELNRLEPIKPHLTHYQRVVTIPLFDESLLVFERLQAIDDKQTVLIIACINVPSPYTGQAIAIDNTRALLTTIWQQYHCLLTSQNLSFGIINDHRHLLIVDRASPGREIPKHQGVGLARKIIVDLACLLIYEGYVHHPWIYISDADVLFPDDYFSSPENDRHPSTSHRSNLLSVKNQQEISAYLFAYRHISEQENESKLMAYYELTLHYYVWGLTFANSPYAFHTLGSTLIIHYMAYAKVRGFPKRNGGEDFYLLNKLAKVGRIIQRRQPYLEIEARFSQRAPFGTGVSLLKLHQMQDPDRDYAYLPLAGFSYLRLFLLGLMQMDHTNCGSTQSFNGFFAQLCQDHQFHPKPLIAALTQINAAPRLKQIAAKSASFELFHRQALGWFDAFKTLKFLHILRDDFLGSQTIAQMSRSPLATPLSMPPSFNPPLPKASMMDLSSPQQLLKEIRQF